MTSKINNKLFHDIMVPAVKEVGFYQRSRWCTSLKIEHKGTINIVTEVDKKSEEMLVETIQHHFPDHDILAEEGSGQRKDSPYKWIIDPLDGTTNFAHGYPLFCISLALEYKGHVVGGIVYDPLRDELFYGFKGEGAFLNDRPIRASKTEELSEALLATGFAYNIHETQNNNLVHFNNMLFKAQAVRRDGVAAIDLCYVACGRFDGFWELNLFPWDTAAGVLIAIEAGAKVSRFDNSSYSVYERDLLVSNGKIHKDVIKVLQQGLQKTQPSS